VPHFSSSRNLKTTTMNSETIPRYCCCGPNITGAKVFAILYMIVLGIIGFIMAIIWTFWKTIHEESLERNVPFWAMSFSFTYWFILSILVIIGANAKKGGLLCASFVLAILGILGLLAYLFIFYFRHPEGLTTGETQMFWVFVGSCVKILLSVWYTLCIFGAMKEAKSEIGGIVYGTPGVAMGQPIPMQPIQPTGYIAVPTQQAPPAYQPSAPPVYPPLPQK